MSEEDRITEFILQCSDLIDELEKALSAGGDLRGYPNYEIILKNLKSWKRLTIDGTLYHPLRYDFGVSKSDLYFGLIDESVRALESFYHDKIYLPKNQKES